MRFLHGTKSLKNSLAELKLHICAASFIRYTTNGVERFLNEMNFVYILRVKF